LPCFIVIPKKKPATYQGDQLGLFLDGVNESITSYGTYNDYSHTKILKAKIENKNVKKKWNSILEFILDKLLKDEISLDEIKRTSNLNIQKGISKEKGFEQIAHHHCSFQRVSANRAVENIKLLTKEFSLQYFIKFEWTEKSENAGNKGYLANNKNTIVYKTAIGFR